MSIQMEIEEGGSPKRLASPFQARRRKPTLATMPDSFLTSFASGEALVYNSTNGLPTFPKSNGKRIRKMTRLSQSFTELSRLSKRTKCRFVKLKSCFRFNKKDTTDLVSHTDYPYVNSVLHEVCRSDQGIFNTISMYLTLKEVNSLSKVNKSLNAKVNKALLRLDYTDRTYTASLLAKDNYKNRVIGLNFSYEREKFDLLPYLNEAHLVSLKLSNINEVNITFLCKCDKLEYLSLCNIHIILGLDTLKFFPKLKLLNISNNSNITSIPMLQPSIQYLTLYNLIGIKDIYYLSYLDKVSVLELDISKDILIKTLGSSSFYQSKISNQLISLLTKKYNAEEVIEYNDEILTLINKYLNNSYQPTLSLLNTMITNNIYVLTIFSSYPHFVDILLDAIGVYLAQDNAKYINIIASTLLKIGLVKETRKKFYSTKLVTVLIQLLYYNNKQTNIEAAGTIWNLAASLNIGKKLACQEEFDCITALVYTLRVRSIKPKTQAIGALRNLAIVKNNAKVLLEKDLIPHLVHIINSIIDPLWNNFIVSDINSFIVQVNEESNLAKLRFETDLNEYFQNIITRTRKLEDDQRTLLRKATATLRLLTASSEFISSGMNYNTSIVLHLFIRLFSLSLLSNEVETTPFIGFQDLGEDILTDSASSLLSMSFETELRNSFGVPVLIRALVKTIKISKNEELLLPACAILWNMALNDQFETMIVGAGGIKALLPCISHRNKLVANKAAGALKNLFFHQDNKQIAVQSKAHRTIIGQVKKLKSSLPGVPPSHQVKLLVLLLGALKMLAGTSLESRLDFIKLGIVGLLSDFLQVPRTRETPFFKERIELVNYSVDILDLISGLLNVPSSSLTDEHKAIITEFCLQIQQFGVKSRLLILTYGTFGSVAEPAKWSRTAKSIIDKIPDSIEVTK